MINSITNYLEELKQNLAGCDPAMIQDALSDAEEYLRSELEYAQKNNSKTNPDQMLSEIIEKYGTPAEIAASYKDTESRLSSTLIPHPRTANDGVVSRFFNIYSDPRAWSGLLYGILSVVTGIIYFSWVVTGISISAGMIILIIGLPITWLFLHSVKGISFVEGRIIEALLDIRMPRKVQSNEMHLSMWNRFKSVFTDARIWLSMLYMILLLPLGVIYFSVYITLISVSLSLIVAPFASYFFTAPIIEINNVSYIIPVYIYPLTIVLGIIIFTLTLHLAKKIGRWHGIMAKSMLVKS